MVGWGVGGGKQGRLAVPLISSCCVSLSLARLTPQRHAAAVTPRCKTRRCSRGARGAARFCGVDGHRAGVGGAPRGPPEHQKLHSPITCLGDNHGVFEASGTGRGGGGSGGGGARGWRGVEGTESVGGGLSARESLNLRRESPPQTPPRILRPDRRLPAIQVPTKARRRVAAAAAHQTARLAALKRRSAATSHSMEL
ncbi:hypothetical protein E2C01_060580 [Portunus trituberculatus]|uniref:Uncharacterized protein n=1 Tax=Portunus trituberculatus TaxID=210409 RepID=A0A5B7H5V8_PORTR|nr:hypothetical protein [Portunus trituberculatus]